MPAAFFAGVDEGKDVLVAQPCVMSVMHFLNADASIRYIQLFDANDIADVTLGTTPPFYVCHMGVSAGGTVIFLRFLEAALSSEMGVSILSFPFLNTSNTSEQRLFTLENPLRCMKTVIAIFKIQ